MTANGALFLCGTPIGNLEDVTIRVLRILREVDLIAAEDTRRTRILLNHYEIKTPLVSYHEHNKKKQGPRLLDRIRSGGKIALVTDAGMPVIADPGYDLVKETLSRQLPLVVVPGPSAVITALTVSGLPSHRFVFEGYISRSSQKRRKLLAELKFEPRTIVFYEVPHRLVNTLRDIMELWGSERQLAVAREITKKFEEVHRGSAAELLDYFEKHAPRGEITLVAAGNKNPVTLPVKDRELVEEVEELLAAGWKPKDAMKAVADRYGLSKRDIYREVVAEKKEH